LAQLTLNVASLKLVSLQQLLVTIIFTLPNLFLQAGLQQQLQICIITQVYEPVL
jgi:hypothetical protein